LGLAVNRKASAAAFILALLFSAVAATQFTNSATAQTYSTITIRSDGSIEGTNKIQCNENFYTFTGNISGGIQVQKSNIVIDGAGFTLQGNGSTGIDTSNGVNQKPSEREIWNVTVKNLRITNCKWGIRCDGGGNHTFYGDYISNDFVTRNETGDLTWENLGIVLWACSGNNITHCTIGGSPAIYMHFGCSNNIVTENNIVFGVHLAISGVETFDRNYWSDYLERYPNASEVDSSGAWNMPYAFVDSQSESRKFQDNHPLMSPLSIPNFTSILPTVQSIQEPAVFPFLLVTVFVIVVAITVTIGLLFYFKKRKR